MEEHIKEILILNERWHKNIYRKRDILEEIISHLKCISSDEICEQFDTINGHDIYNQLEGWDISYLLEERMCASPLNQIIDICYHKCLFDTALFVIRLFGDGNIDNYCVIECIDRSDYDSVKILFERFDLYVGVEEDAIDAAIENHDLGILDLIIERYPSSIDLIESYLDKIDDDEEMKEYLMRV